MPKKQPPAPLVKRTEAAHAFFQAVDDLNAASKFCSEAGLTVHCNCVEDRCIPYRQYRAAVESGPQSEY